MGLKLVTIGELDAHREKSPELIGSEAVEDIGEAGEPALPGSAEAIWKHWAKRKKMARSLLSADVHIDLWCRHCKCAIERASSFERIDELVAFVVTDPGQGKIKPDRVEQRNV